MNTNSAFPIVAPICPEGFTLASKKIRFGTFVLDILGYMLLSAIVGFWTGLIFRRAGAAFFNEYPQVIGFVLYFGYYVLLESTMQQTLGKIAFKTMVVNDAGSKPTFRQVLIRSASRFIPFEGISCLSERGWHDSLSKTHVVLKASKPIV